VWREVIRLVTGFETNLRVLMKEAASPEAEAASSANEKIREHTASMGTVVAELGRYLEEAESKHWNLLICAIGAELEAFKEAQSMLESVFTSPDKKKGESTDEGHSGKPNASAGQTTKASAASEQPDESDNEVPADLLVSHYEDHGRKPSESFRSESDSREDDSENEVPPEFLDGTEEKGGS
jgi:hypothetical protein